MAIDYTTTGLIADIKRRGSIPTSQALFLSADFIALMNDILIMTLLPLIHSAREDYFLTISDTPLVANQAAYTVPSRAAGNTLRDIVLVDSNGNEASIPNLGIAGVKNNAPVQNNLSFGFYFRANKVVLYPAPTSTDKSLRFKYERRPNLLIPTTSAGLITAVDPGTRQLTLSGTPSGFTTLKTYDIISNVPPFVSMGDDLAVSSIVGNIVTLSAAVPDGVAAGMYLCEAGESPIPQLSPEGHYVLAQMTTVKCLESMGDKGLDKAKALADRMLNDFLGLVDPRVDESPEKIVNRSGIFDHSAGYSGQSRIW